MSDAATPATFGAECPPSECGKIALDQLQEALGVAVLPSGFRALSGSDNGISDLYANLKRQLTEDKLSYRIKLLASIAGASVVGSRPAVEYFARVARAQEIPANEILEAVAVASTCTTFNTYYRFRDQITDEDKEAFKAFRAPFNSNVFVKAALPKLTVEAICIAVSSINGCHECTQSHMAKAKELGVTNEQIDELMQAVSGAMGAALAAAALDGLV